MKISENRIILLIIALVSVFFVKCGMEKKADGNKDLVEEWKKEKVLLKKEIQVLINKIDSEITAIEKNSGNVSENAVDEWQQKLADLRKAKKDLSQMMTEIEQQTAEEWILFKQDVEKGFEEAKLTIKEVSNEIEQSIDS